MSDFPNSNFVHWHTHSCYSTFDGLAKLEDLVMAARSMGFPALALTDHGNVGGWIKFIQQCKATKDKDGKAIAYPTIKPILGTELYLSRDHTVRSKEGQPDGRKGNRHINVYAMNFKGYQNVCTLSHMSWVNGFYFDPRVDIDMLAEHAEGVMCGSACLSSVINVNLLHEGRDGFDGYNRAKKAASMFKDIYGENFFLEIQYHGINDQFNILPDILKLSKELSIPAICTNDSHYIRAAQAISQEVLMCMSTGRCVKDPKHMHFPYDEFYLKSAEEMAKIFGCFPQLLTNSVALAERINNVEIDKNLFGGMRLPQFKLPAGYTDSCDYLEKLAWDGLKGLGWHNSAAHVAALKKELTDVRVAKLNNNYDFATYFLIVWDYVTKARAKGILVGGGRGLGYASVLLRCLKVAYGPDPLKYGLLWERFLGFDDRRFIKESDFGFEEEQVKQILASDEEEQTEEEWHQ